MRKIILLFLATISTLLHATEEFPNAGARDLETALILSSLTTDVPYEVTSAMADEDDKKSNPLKRTRDDSNPATKLSPAKPKKQKAQEAQPVLSAPHLPAPASQLPEYLHAPVWTANDTIKLSLLIKNFPLAAPQQIYFMGMFPLMVPVHYNKKFLSVFELCKNLSNPVIHVEADKHSSSSSSSSPPVIVPPVLPNPQDRVWNEDDMLKLSKLFEANPTANVSEMYKIGHFPVDATEKYKNEFVNTLISLQIKAFETIRNNHVKRMLNQPAPQ